jgi:hypothetical protein
MRRPFGPYSLLLVLRATVGFGRMAGDKRK